MRRLLATILTTTLTVPALPGCVEDKPAPRLASPDRNERIEAVRNAQTQYGASPAPATPAAVAGKEAAGTKLPPIEGSWIFKGTIPGFTEEFAVTIRGGELRLPGVQTWWKNIRPVPNSVTRYSAVKVSEGFFWGMREDPVEFYFDADGILHHDDADVLPLFRCRGIITLRRP
jgi:hypothetical protein